MSNVIPLKRSPYAIPEDEFEKLLQEVTRNARRYHDFTSLPAVMRKVLSDALKRDKSDGETNLPAS